MLPFFKTEKEVFGLEISNLSIKAAKVKKKSKKYFLEWVEKEEMEAGIIEKGEIKNEEKFVEVLKKTVKGKWRERLKSDFAIVSLPEERIFSKILKIPKVPEKDIPNLLLFEAEKHIPLPLEKIYLDYQIVSPPFENFNYLEVLMIACPKEVADSYLRAVKKAGIFPFVFEPETFAIARTLIKQEVSTEPVLILDFGATKTRFIVFAGKSIRFTSILPIGSFHLTETLAKNLNLSQEKAEELKIKEGLGMHFEVKIEKEKGKVEIKTEEIFEILVPVLVDLVQQIKKYLDYYISYADHLYLNAEGKPISKIILSGGGSRLKGLDKFLSAELEYEVEFGNPFSNLFPSPNLKQTRTELLSFVAAIGLALRGAKESFYD